MTLADTATGTISCRDLGVEAATNGAMRAEVVPIDNAESPRPTG